MPRSNWDLKVLVFKKREKPAYPERTLGREPRTNSTRIWHTFEPGQDHIGGRRVLSPLRHLCFPSSPCCKDQFVVLWFSTSVWGGLGSWHPPKARKRNGRTRAWLLIFSSFPWPSTVRRFLGWNFCTFQCYSLIQTFSWISAEHCGWYNCFLLIFRWNVICISSVKRSFKGPLFLNTWPAPSNSCLLLSRIVSIPIS